MKCVHTMPYMSNPIRVILSTLFFSIIPISELRGAIPYAVLNNLYPLPIWLAYIISVFGNICVTPLCYLFINTIHKLLYKIKIYRNIFDKTVIKAQKKLSNKMNKYGVWGLMIFVAVPLPVTGAWTGALAAWISGLKLKRCFPYISLGVIISGLIVSILVITGSMII